MSENFLCVDEASHALFKCVEAEYISCDVKRVDRPHRCVDKRIVFFGPLAQWLVQETHNLLVASSSLARPTTFSMSLCQNH